MNTSPSAARNDTTVTRLHDPRVVLLGRVLWIVIGITTLAVIIAILPYVALNAMSAETHARLSELGFSPDSEVFYYVAAQVLQVFMFLLVGVLLFARKSDDWLAVLVSAMLMTTAMNLIDVPPQLLQESPLWRLPVALVFMVGNISFMLFLLIFPDGKLLSPKRGRWWVIAYLLWTMFEAYMRYLNPETNAEMGEMLELITSVWWIGGIGAQIYRYRKVSSRQQRQQTKWVILGIIMGVVSLIATNVLDLLVTSSLQGTVYVIYVVVIAPLIDLVPTTLGLLAVVFAVLRYRIWDIDLAINRSLVYGALTLILAAIFLAGAFLIQGVLGKEQSGIALAVSVLATGLFFNPLRKALQHFIDRRFYGLRFDLNELRKARALPDVKNPGVLTGTTLDVYHVLDVIGKGGMGEVYKGVGEGKTVAIKILQELIAEKTDNKVRFEREAKALTELDHPNIVKLYSSGEFNGMHYMAMEYVDGTELGTKVKQDGPLAMEDARIIMQDLTGALDYAHKRGMVHRDIKPSNIMLRFAEDNETLRAVLMDFGVAKIKDAKTNLTGTGAVGTIEYMAPEQIQESKTVDHRADIYALGVVLYEMMTGERPFKGNPAQVLFAHIQQPPPDPRDVAPNVPRSVAHTILRALSKDPKDRFDTAGEMLQAFG